MNEEIKQTMEALRDLPSRKRDKAMELIDLDNKIKELRLKLKLRENDITSQVMTAKDENGKKLFTNKEMRDIEQDLRCSRDEYYITQRKELELAENQYKHHEILYVYLKDKFNSERAVAIMLGGDLK